MSAFSQNNKRAVETFLVAGASATTLPNLGTALVNSSTGAVNLTNGQLGFFAAYPMDGGSVLNLNTALNHTTTYSTIANAPWIQIFQGTEDSANPGASTKKYPLFPRPYEASQVIKGTNNLTVTKQAPVTPTSSVWVMGSAQANHNAITAADNTEYGITVAFRGRMMDELYSPEATNFSTFYYTTPNYTSLGTAQPTDHLLQNLAWQINRNSKAVAMNRTKYRGSLPVVALLVDSNSPSAGVAIGGGDPIAAGDTIPVITTNFGTRSIVLTEDQATSIKNAMIAATGQVIAAVDANILNINLTTAGTATGGVADTLILLALDRDQAFEDRIPQVKTRLDVGLPAGFDTTTTYLNEEEQASEGQGQGRWLDLWYKATHGQRKYSLDHTMDPVISFDSPIDTTDAYYQYTILHEDVNQVDTHNVVVSPLKEIILVPDANTSLITAIDNVFGAWVASANSVGIVSL